MSKTILITGATDGIGRLTAEKLVELGHKVLIHGRNEQKLQAVEQELNSLGQKKVETFRADLSVFSEVEALAQAILNLHSHLDVVINNAGIYKTSSPITQDNLDIRFVVNTLAPYLLTQRLLPAMDTSGRVVNLSSAAQAPVDLDAMSGKYHLDNQMSAYAQSKLAITLWSQHLAEQLGENGPAIIAVNPGSLLASKMVKEGFGVAGNDLSIGADILVKASLSDDFQEASGKYFDNDSGHFANPHSDAQNPKIRADLVATMENLLASLH